MSYSYNSLFNGRVSALSKQYRHARGTHFIDFVFQQIIKRKTNKLFESTVPPYCRDSVCFQSTKLKPPQLLKQSTCSYSSRLRKFDENSWKLGHFKNFIQQFIEIVGFIVTRKLASSQTTQMRDYSPIKSGLKRVAIDIFLRKKQFYETYHVQIYNRPLFCDPIRQRHELCAHTVTFRVCESE